MTQRADVIVVGSANLDTTLRVRRVPSPGETMLASGSSVTPGGKGANQAVAAAADGGKVHFIGALGRDSAGETMRESLRSHGVDISGTHLTQAPTGTATVIVDDSGENLIVVNPGANALLSTEHVDEVLAEIEAPVVLCQLEVPLETVRAAAEQNPRRTFVLNPAPMMSADRLASVLPLTDILVPNQSELAQLTGREVPTTLDEVTDCVSGLEYRGAVVVTLGALGAAVFQTVDGAATHVPAPTVNTVDTSGAGDVFCGVLAYGLSQGSDLVTATRRAVALAAESTTFHGAQMSSRNPV
ncbi:ribokinase [Ornithinimicrobium panacihumi]|uniref:ribokinase n=1 Tax=Ornithinimicrobium panacihumi TaxID=2008449 RepID=UPI003F8C979F